MKYASARRIARPLIEMGTITITDAAQVAGVYRQTAAQWAIGIDAVASRRAYLNCAWSTLSLSGESEGKFDQDLAVEIMRAGLALPVELAPLVHREVQTVRLWAHAAGIDAKSARRTACIALWCAEVAKIEAKQAEHARRYQEYRNGGRERGMVLTCEAEVLYPDEFALLSEAERKRLTTYQPAGKK